MRNKEFFKKKSNVKMFFDYHELGVDPGIVIQPLAARAFGLKESIILQFIHNKITEMELSPTSFAENFHDGRFWVNKTFGELVSDMPYIGSLRTHKTIIQSLRDLGVLESGQFGDRFDRTNWYAIDYAVAGRILGEAVSK